MMKSEIGIIGLGVMGSSLALNFADKGIAVSAYNRNVSGVEEDVAKKFIEENASYKNLQGYDNLNLFIQSLDKPRKILLMIKAGPVVDVVIKDLLPLLSPHDIIMDGGNSWFKDTNRRIEELQRKKIHLLGIGISGGEEGARKGPSIMPGGNSSAYQKIEYLLNKIAAKDKNDKACSNYIGNGGAGHFVKMVHNGIEYAEMQLIAEVFLIMNKYLSMELPEIAKTFKNWNNKDAGSFLLEITVDILNKKENDEYLLDKILDAAEQKGTGWWASATAMEISMPFSVITEAVMARNLSTQKKQRINLAGIYDLKSDSAKLSNELINKIYNAYQMARIINHAIGFELIYNSGRLFGSDFNLSEIARIWTNGCIIRSKLMEQLVEYFQNEVILLQHPELVKSIKNYYFSLTEITTTGLKNNLALPVFSAALNYFTGITTANSTANLIQAQRDYFGAHTYRRTDKPEDKYYHTEWSD